MKTISYYELMEYRKQGLTYNEIGKIAGVTGQRVSQWLYAGKIGGNHRKKDYKKNSKQAIFLLNKTIYEKIKEKAKSENKFAYEVINDILKEYFKL